MLEQSSSGIVAQLARCETLEALYSAFNEEILRLNFDFYSMAIVPLDPKFDNAPLLHGTFPESYIEGYRAIEAHRIDPYLEIMAKRTTPVFHSEVLPAFQTTDIGRKLTVLAEESDIRRGYMVPLPSAGMARGVGYWATSAKTDFVETVRANEAYLVFIATHFAATAEDLGLSPNPAESAQLTRRETAILHLCADGLNNTEIAWQLKITERTVRFHLGNTYRKLGARGRAQALTRAIRMGLVDTSGGISAENQQQKPVFLP
jgi:DNA-binding CsgD family transcriptional regulator